MSSAERTTSPPLKSEGLNVGHPSNKGSPDPETRRVSDTFPLHPPLHWSDPTHRGDWRHHGRPQSPGLTWRKDYSQTGPKCGRVLVIDFLKADNSKAGNRKVVAEEISHIDGLRRWYGDSKRSDEAVLRVFHVQNAWWATRFLLRKFNIDNRDDLVGTDFGKYVKWKRPERRGGKPFLNGKTWRTQHDPWRGISKTSFGLDYLKPYRVRDPVSITVDDPARKMMELNCFDEEDNPIYGYDVHVQRVSCYVQHKETNPELPTDPDIENPYNRENGVHVPPKPHEYVPKLDTLDNGNAILIFDNSESGSFEDTLIAARRDWESRWRRLPFYLAYEGLRDSVDTDDAMALQCSKMILQDIWKGVINAWDEFLDHATTHMSILEDKVYEQPADETRAPELWTNSSQWLKVEKLLFVHVDVCKELRTRLSELTETKEDDWLDDSNGDFDRLSNLLTEDLTKPTESLISLLYQSVSIRDSRHSLQLGTSMWRLSWITFIFLPLTFISTFFGMNTDTFVGGAPSIKWYFVSVVPFMLFVLFLWYVMKHILARQRQTPYQRGIYETFFHDMAVSNPNLWSRTGPRDYIVPSSRLDKIKWYLIKHWSAPEKTIRATNSSNPEGTPDDLGTWSRCKRALIRRWTTEIHTFQSRTGGDSSSTDLEAGGSDPGLLAEGILDATEMLTVPGAKTTMEDNLPDGMSLGGGNPRIRVERHLSPPGSRPRSSSSDNRNSGLLVEEEDLGWLSEMGKQGKGWYRWTGGSSKRAGSTQGSHKSDEDSGRKMRSSQTERDRSRGRTDAAGKGESDRARSVGSARGDENATTPSPPSASDRGNEQG